MRTLDRGERTRTEVPFLVGERVLLRSLTKADCAGPYVAWFNDAEVCRYNAHHMFPYRSEEALAYVRRANQSRTDLILAIVLRRDSRHIGNIALQHIDGVNRSAELAIIIGEKDCWGEGYAKEAARLLLTHGFTTLNLRRVHCDTSDDNHPMQKLAHVLGMKKEGRRRRALFKHNRYVDLLEYGVLKSEYPPMVHRPHRRRDARVDQ